jgi:tetratricopeptide (TPR) repeat protein
MMSVSLVRRLVVSCCLVVAAALPAAAHGDLHYQIQQLTRQLRKAPSAQLYLKRGELHRAHGEYKDALQDYAQAERMDPALHVVRLSRGRALLESSDARGAQRALDSYLQLHPDHGEARLLYARAFKQSGEHVRADAQYERALSLAEDPTPDLFLERATNLEAAGDKPRALAVVEAGLSRLGPLVTLQEAALQLQCANADFDGALARIDAMLEGQARPERLLSRKAEILDMAGRHEAAAQVRLDALARIEQLAPLQRNQPALRKLELALRAAEPQARVR